MSKHGKDSLDIAIGKIVTRVDRFIHPSRVDGVVEFFRSVLTIFFLLFASLSTGVIGYMGIEDFGFIDALYMTIITISTVGFGEIHELSQTGRVFVSIFIVTNIGFFAYAVSTLASFIVEGKFFNVIKNLRIGRKIDNMTDHVIVCGYGRYGKNVIEHFLNQGQECVLLEMDIEKCGELEKKKKVIVLDGDATDEDSLLEAGIKEAHALITTLPVDADNVYVILSARQLNPNLKIISRANHGSSKRRMKQAGANHVLVPENIGGFYMSSLVTKPDIINIMNEISGLGKTGSRMVEMILDPLPQKWHGKVLEDLDIEATSGVHIVGVKQPNLISVINPEKSLPLMEGMVIIVLGNAHQIELFNTAFKDFQHID